MDARSVLRKSGIVLTANILSRCYCSLISLTLIFSNCLSLTIFPHRCPQPNCTENFNLTQFEGVWYEVQRTFSLLEIGLKCSTTVITNSNNGKAFFRRSGLNIINRHFVMMQGKLYTEDLNVPGRMDLRLGALRFRLSYSIIDTNYNDFAVAWACYESPLLNGTLGHAEHLWILSRRSTLQSEFVEMANKKLDDLGISRAALISTSYEDCTNMEWRFNNKLMPEFYK